MRSPRAAAWLGLLALALCVQRLRTYDEPFERDIMTYAVIGHEMVLGNRLYSDILDHKLVQWMEEEYEPLPAVREMAPFQLLVRRDSALRGRVAGLL